MGFIFKSTIGLGCVYFAMFGQALQSADLAPTANLCASAAKAGLMSDPTLRAQWAAAGCAVAMSAVTQRLAAPSAAPPPPAPRAAPQGPTGTLTEADMRDPWFGPGRIPRKLDRRG